MARAIVRCRTVTGLTDFALCAYARAAVGTGAWTARAPQRRPTRGSACDRLYIAVRPPGIRASRSIHRQLGRRPGGQARGVPARASAGRRQLCFPTHPNSGLAERHRCRPGCIRSAFVGRVLAAGRPRRLGKIVWRYAAAPGFTADLSVCKGEVLDRDSVRQPQLHNHLHRRRAISRRSSCRRSPDCTSRRAARAGIGRGTSSCRGRGGREIPSTGACVMDATTGGKRSDDRHSPPAAGRRGSLVI